MKFVTFSVYNIDKLDEVAKAGDNLAKNLPEGYKILAIYACGTSNPFPGVQLAPGTLVSVGIVECESAEAMGAANLQYMAAGVESIYRIPVMDVTPGGAEEVVEKLKA